MITVYTTTKCPFCDSVKTLLKEEGHDYMLINIEENEDAKKLLADKGYLGVPVTDINGKFIQGYDKPGILKILNLE